MIETGARSVPLFSTVFASVNIDFKIRKAKMHVKNRAFHRFILILVAIVVLFC